MIDSSWYSISLRIKYVFKLKLAVLKLEYSKTALWSQIIFTLSTYQGVSCGQTI